MWARQACDPHTTPSSDVGQHLVTQPFPSQVPVCWRRKTAMKLCTLYARYTCLEPHVGELITSMGPIVLTFVVVKFIGNPRTRSAAVGVV